MLPVPHNLTIRQGATFQDTVFFYDGDPVVKPIASIGTAYPPVLTVVGHGLPTSPIPVRLVGIKGPTELNTDTDLTSDSYRVYAHKIDVDTFSLPDLDAAASAVYKGGGYLSYVPPKDLTGWTARMQIRTSVSDATVILALTETAGLVLGGTEGSVAIELDATQTAAFTFSSAVYDLELVDGSGNVVSLATGKITLSLEITR